MVWLNVDKPTKKCTVHRDENCRHVLRWSGGTGLKGGGFESTDGGWLEFATEAELRAWVSQNRPNFDVSTCC